MKIHPRYKCRACGKLYTDFTVTVNSLKSIVCFDDDGTHVCDTVISDDRLPDNNRQTQEYIGCIDLVGYVIITKGSES